MHFGYFTTTGLVRETNEDCGAFFVKSEQEFLALVCDGMGGHQGGGLASSQLVKAIIHDYQMSLPFTNYSLSQLQEWLKELILKVQKVFQALAQANDQYINMGTTMVCALRINEVIYIANTGDSRAYFFDGQNLKQLTKDHNLSQKMKEAGTTLSQDQPQGLQNLLYNCVSVENDITIDWFRLQAPKGQILLVTDGVYNLVSPGEMVNLLQTSPTLHLAAYNLCHKANQNGGFDNNAVVIGEW